MPRVPDSLPTSFLKTSPLLLPALVVALATASCGDQPYRDKVSATTALMSYDACEDLEADLKEMLLGELEASYQQADAQRRWWGWLDVPMASEERANDGDAAMPPSVGREEGVDFSGTNNQEAGVDEADLAKTDGYHFYVLNGQELHIFGVPEFGDLEPLANLEVEGHPQHMLVKGDRAVVFSSVNTRMLHDDHPLTEHLVNFQHGYWWRVHSATKITVVDISLRAEPEVVREIYMEGWYQTARRIDDAVLLGVYGYLNVPVSFGFWGTRSEMYREYVKRKERIESLELKDLIPQIYERTSEGDYHAYSLSQAACASFHRPTNSSGRGVASVMSLSLLGEELELQAHHVVSNHPTFYASATRFYIAESARDGWWFWFNQDHPDQTNIHAFDIVAAGQTRYHGSGRVSGRVLNQFSLGEHEDHLRIATTELRDRRWWEDGAMPTENHVFVISLDSNDGSLSTVGHVGGLAEGERVFSARFVGDKGYVVTFVDIDPLFTIDLSDPTNPRVIGELKIPGFSTYIHPIEDDRLLTMGVGGDDFGANWQAQVSMFDVSDFSDPKLQDVEELVTEGSWGWSEAMYEHKAFTYWAPRKLLAVPVSSSVRQSTSQGTHWTFYSRLELISVDTDSGLSRYGTIDHSPLFNAEGVYWRYTDVRRSYFMGDYIYTVSDAGVMVHTIDDLSLVTSHALTGHSYDHYEWWW